MDRPILHAQDDLLDTVRGTINDEGTPQRYSDTQVYRSLNWALERMSKYRTPMVYTPAALENARSLALPDYMDRRIEVQVRTTPNNDEPEPWRTLQGWDIVPDGDGGLTLEFRLRPVSGDLRILWYAPQPQLPLTLPTLAADIDSDDTSLTLTLSGSFVPRRAGYIKVNDEWLFYAGLTRTSGTAHTLSNLERAQDDTAAGSHLTGDTVAWGVPLLQDGQLQLLLAHTMVQLHMLFMTDASTNERDNHSIAVRFWQDEARRLAGQIPGKRSKLRLSASAFGEMW